MATSNPAAPAVAVDVHRPFGFGPLALAGMASLGAGAIHAAAIGLHAEHRQAASTFAALALLQLGWGAIALVGRRRLLAAAGVVVNAGAAVGWVLAKTSGIGFVDGLGEVESIQWPDALAAALATVAVVIVARGLLVQASGRPARVPGRLALNGVGTAVLVASLVGLVASGSHTHAGGHADSGTEEAAGHAHDDSSSGSSHASAVAPKAYDPELPLDLSGVPGVTPVQQARAENLIAITLARLPRFADYRVAEAAGYRSIRDGFTGHEHFINWDYIDDDHVLDPDYPESLVYVPGPNGTRMLVSAMFMMKQGSTLDDVPDLGGPLTQWHIHDDLCFTDDPVAPRISGVTSVGGTCAPPSVKFTPVPMIHVWITKHECGPFSALEGVGAGQVKEGETHLCDHAHGSGGT